jgi:hypothetical protein
MIFRTDPYKFLEKAQTMAVQMLLHPMHFSENGGAYPEPMLRYLHRMSSVIDEGFSVNATFRKKVKGKLSRYFRDYDPE